MRASPFRNNIRKEPHSKVQCGLRLFNDLSRRPHKSGEPTTAYIPFLISLSPIPSATRIPYNVNLIITACHYYQARSMACSRLVHHRRVRFVSNTLC
ncbi:hypothetical protein RSAG8_05273, partial [Rhizoctonia solani AG-8 WAC10335]